MQPARCRARADHSLPFLAVDGTLLALHQGMNTKTEKICDLKVGDRIRRMDPNLCRVIEYTVESFEGRQLVLRSYYGTLELCITWDEGDEMVEVI